MAASPSDADMAGQIPGENNVMPELPSTYFTSRPPFKEYFDQAHDGGALDKKTKELMHLAVVLAVNCEP